jgi:hypothetical protein
MCWQCTWTPRASATRGGVSGPRAPPLPPSRCRTGRGPPRAPPPHTHTHTPPKPPGTRTPSAGYEGGGNFRHTFLTSSPSAAHVVPHGLHANTALSGGYTYPARPADGVTAASATLLAFAEVEGDGAAPAPVSAVFTLYAADGAAVAASARASGSAGPAGAPAATLSATLTLANASAWSVARPYLYTLSVALSSGHVVNATVGLRAVRFDADQGVFVNEQRVRFRAYCDHGACPACRAPCAALGAPSSHLFPSLPPSLPPSFAESFAATGMAVPDRVNLFRYQAMRGMGGNGRRFSHNPPAPSLLDLADRLGLLTLDENRVFAQGLAGNMRDLVERDRNHPSVVFWSFCNEPGCNNADKTAPQQPTQDFKYAVEVADGGRAVTGNMCIGWGSCPNMAQYLEGLNMSLQLDVQGFSHVDSNAFAQYHARWPVSARAARRARAKVPTLLQASHCPPPPLAPLPPHRKNL